MAPNSGNKVDFHRLGSELWDIAGIFRDDTLKTTEYLEEFSYFLFLKLIDDYEKQREELARLQGAEFVSYLPGHLRFSTWAEKILASDGKTVKTAAGELAVVDYVRSIFSELAEVEDHHGWDLSLIRKLFKDHIWRIRYSPTIKELLRRLEALEFEPNFDALGRAYEFIVQKLGEQKQYGQYFTPRHIIHFMVELADPEIGEKIYDPAAGTGGFILRAFEVVNGKIQSLAAAGDETENLRRQLKEESLYAVEKAPDVYKLALMNMILHYGGSFNLYEADSLDSRAQTAHKEKYDVVLTNPPYGPLAQSRVDTFEFHAKRYEALFIQHIMAALRPSVPGKKRARAVVIILDKLLFDNSSVFRNLRRKLLREFDLKAVFSMPQGLFQPYSGVKTTVLYFEKPTEEEWNRTEKQGAYTTKRVLFVDVKDDGFTFSTQRRPVNGAFQGDDPNIYAPPCGNLPKAVEVFRKWLAWLKAPRGPLPDFIDNDFCWAATIDEIKGKEYNLNPGLYRKTAKGKWKWEWTALENILVGKPQYGANTPAAAAYNGARYVRITDVDDDGFLRDEAVSPQETDEKYILEDGDLLLARSGSVGRSFLYRHSRHGNEKFLFAGYFIRFRIDTDKALPEYVFYLTKSTYYAAWINNTKKSSSQSNINAQDYKSLPLPLPPLSVQRELVARLDKQQALIAQCNAAAKAIYRAGIDDSVFEGDWEWVQLADPKACLLVTDGTHDTPKKLASGIPLVTVRNISEHRLALETVDYFISQEDYDKIIKRSHPAKGDILFTHIGTVGQAVLIDTDIPFGIKNVALFKPNRDNILPEYLLYVLRSDLVRKQIGALLKGSNQSFVNLGNLKSLTIPLPPLEKQQEIVDFLKVQFETLAKLGRLKENARKTIKMILDKEVFGE